MEEYNFFNMEQILGFLGIKHDFENKENKEYPFYDKPSDIIFSWGYITVERKGIEKEIQNKISSNGEYVSELKEIRMLYHIPFYNKRTKNTGTIIQNISLTFRYDKTYKYGDINKSLPEVCYAIERMGNKTNDFYVIGEDNIHFFISNYIMNNQWGIGTTLVESSPKVQLNDNFKEIRENDELNIKLDNKETEIQILTDDIKADEVEYKNEIETLRKQNEEYSKQLDLDYVDKNYISKKKIEDTIEELKGKLKDISKRREKSKTKEEKTILWCLEIRTDERIKTLQELL